MAVAISKSRMLLVGNRLADVVSARDRGGLEHPIFVYAIAEIGQSLWTDPDNMTIIVSTRRLADRTSNGNVPAVTINSASAARRDSSW